MDQDQAWLARRGLNHVQDRRQDTAPEDGPPGAWGLGSGAWAWLAWPRTRQCIRSHAMAMEWWPVPVVSAHSERGYAGPATPEHRTPKLAFINAEEAVQSTTRVQGGYRFPIPI